MAENIEHTSSTAPRTSLSLAVVSDLHAFDKNTYTTGKGNEDVLPSFLDMSIGEDRTTVQPIAALKRLISENHISADMLVCPGDMGDKANPTTINYAWSKLQELGNLLQARRIVAIPGNHDHDSRSSYCKFDPRGALQTLSPRFPLSDDDVNNRFWARNYTILSDDICRVLLLNSSAFHGINNEKEHGRISPWTLEAIERDLDGSSAQQINVLVCHHHPQKLEDLRLSDYEVMEGGQTLLAHLGSGRFGKWLVIHGHRHYPKISYAQGATGGPVVLSAGSLCAFCSPETQAKNQFYVLRFDLRDFQEHGFVGRFSAWDWANGRGWIPAAGDSGLPSSGGFGYRTQLDMLSGKIARIVGASPKVDWKDITTQLSELLFLIPDDLAILEQELSHRHSLKLVKSNEGLIIQIGKAV